jgi:hypothetical protein
MSHFKLVWQVLFSGVPFIQFLDQLNLPFLNRLRLAGFDYFWKVDGGFETN